MKRRGVSLAIVLLVVTSTVVPAVSASATEPKPITSEDEAVTFVERILEMKGHLNASIYWAAQGNVAEAKTHAKHPKNEYWNLIGPEIEAANATFAQRLESKLNALPEKAATMEPGEYRAHIRQDIYPLLDEAVNRTVATDARSGLAFEGEVAMKLLDRIGVEYANAMNDQGEIVNLMEYWDARGFANVLETRYDAEIAPELSSANAEELAKFIDTVQRKIASKASPSELKPVLEETAHELKEYTGAGAVISERAAAVTFVRQIEEMKGHLDSSVHWAKAGNVERAKKHARHPVDEYWSLVGPTLQKADADFAERLKANLSALPKQAASMSASEYRAHVTEDIYPMLNEAVEKVVAAEIRGKLAFHGEVVNALLTRAADEYAVGVTEDGTLVKAGEYWDAHGFVVRAQARYTEHIKPELSAENAEELAKFLETIERKVNEKASPAAVKDAISQTRAEISEYTGAGETASHSGSSGPNATIQRIKENLDRVVALYEQDKPTKAKQLLTETYLTQFEGLEGPLIEQRPQLVETLEAAFNKKLPTQIDNGALVSEVEATVENMKEDLTLAKKVLASGGETTVEIDDETTTTQSGTVETTAGSAATQTQSGTSKTTETNETTTTSGPGFGVVLALLALIGAGLLAARQTA